jgi:hypothetical protein
MLTRVEAEPWRNLASSILAQAVVEFITDADPPIKQAPRAVVFLFTGQAEWLIDALDQDPDVLRKDWLNKRKEYQRLLRNGNKVAYDEWVSMYFRSYPTFAWRWREKWGVDEEDDLHAEADPGDHN